MGSGRLHGSHAVAELKVFFGHFEDQINQGLHGSHAVAELKDPLVQQPRHVFAGLHGSHAVAELKACDLAAV